MMHLGTLYALGREIFGQKLTTSRDGPVKSTETKEGMKTQRPYPTTVNSGKERLEDHATCVA